MIPSSKSKSDYDFFALHGFLGLPSDWSLFPFINHPQSIGHEELDFFEWGKAFNASIPEGKQNVLLGYSMGGRLAMHAVIADKDKWKAAIFVSAHPGLTSEEEKKLRYKSDQQWAEKFLKQPWNDLMKEWNSNPVFGTRPFPFARSEELFNRQKLAEQLTRWSLGKQESLITQLKGTRVPMLVISGEQDKKFCEVAQTFKDFATVSIIPQSAHRVPWDQPEEFYKEINQFIEELS